MKNQFEKWMKEKENKSINTVSSYANSISRISRHYYENTGRDFDLYKITDLKLLRSIENDYGIGGKYSDFGNYGNGTIRNSIATYVRFIEFTKIGQELNSSDKIYFGEDVVEDCNSEDKEVSNNYNFTYERDLKYSLVIQAEDLFPGYKIFGNSREGIEYNIEGKRIDLLLENSKENSLLAIELKAGIADFRVFGQVSMYLGLLSKKFPNKTIKGLIIAGEIDETLKNASLITDKIDLKTYKMNLLLENII